MATPTRTPAILSAPPIPNPNFRSYHHNNRGGRGGGGGGSGERRYSNGSMGGGYDNRRPIYDEGRNINYDDDFRGHRNNPPEWEDRRAMGGASGGGGGRGYNDYSVRRSRSPSFDERRVKRQRSISPRRDAYSERPREYEGHGGRRPDYRSEREPIIDTRPPHNSLNQRNNDPQILQPPESLPYLVTYRYFTDFMQQQQPSSDSAITTEESLNEAWKKYQMQYLRKQNHNFWNEQKEKEWFREKYEPSEVMESLRESSKSKGLEGAVESWLEAMESGLIDVGLDQSTTKEVQLSRIESKIEEESEAIQGLVERYTVKHQGNCILLPAHSNQLFIEAFSSSISRSLLEEHVSQAPGFEKLAISEPVAWKNFSRVAWITFPTTEEADAAHAFFSANPLENHNVRIVRTAPLAVPKRYAPGSMNEPDRIEIDLANIRVTAASFEKHTSGGDSRGSAWIEADHVKRLDELESSSRAIKGEEEETNVDIKVSVLNAINKKTLDLYLHYLRHVYYTCYYCVCTFDHTEELNRRCARHERRPLGTIDEPLIRVESAAFLKNLDDKIVLLINKEDVDPRDFGGDSYDEELHRICEPCIKHEDEGKLRCKECNKLFSALKFIEKHISSKHEEALGDSLERLKYFNNYVLDPAHLTAADREAPSKSFRTFPAKDRRHSEIGGGADRSLSDRIGGRLTEALGDDQEVSYIPGNKYQKAKNGARNTLAPPAGMALDPRATSGRFTGAAYADLDGAPSGEADVVLLPY